MSQFSLDYAALDAAAPGLGRCAVVPWDSTYFGFNVATYVPGHPYELPVGAEEIVPLLRRWMQQKSVELVSCNVPADSFAWMGRLAADGFCSVDLSLLAFARKLNTLLPARVTVRAVEDADVPGLERIAMTAFRFGRYHADARFPRALADERYRQWVRNALAARGETEFLLTCGPVGNPAGLFHAVLRGDVADLRLAAVDPALHSGFLGAGLFVGALTQLVARGARRAQARLSAGNIPILNLYSSLGFAFHEAEAVYHLHAHPAPHLVSLP